MINKAEEIFQKLIEDFGFKGATGEITFKLKDISITVNQNNVVGNILEEWIEKWFIENNVPHKHNKGQSSPDFWLNIESDTEDWLEVKSFTGSPNFDIAAYNSFINLIIQKPYKLHSSYLLIKYKMEDGKVIIENCWLKKIWEISAPSEKWSVKVQDKKGIIFNIRPAVWYSDKTDYPTFECLEDFLSALEEVIYVYPDTHLKGATWKKELIKSYKDHYGRDLNIPRWMDIKDKYKKR
ncbi:NgoBV family restriction endonuclease [Capnocytophaga canimorsus]|uniref:NgoBV family restriction endonuclease n=1 Tax=Capnocytophaga canimorsus TaxID=28188 RepID=UPI0037D8D019